MAADIQILENHDYVAVHLPDNSLVYAKSSKVFSDPPFVFSTSRRLHEDVTTDGKGEPLSGGRWSKMPRREAEAWYHRALKYVKSLERKVVEPKIAQGA